MKKLALVLGSLLIAATASAKEVVAAPVVVAEPVVEEVVPVVVPEFKASGSIAFENEYRGQGEHGANGENGRLYQELNANFNITELDTIRSRVRNRESFASGDDASSESKDLRWRWDHKFGYLGDTKITQKSRFEWRDHNNYDHFQLGYQLGFADYAPQFSNFNITGVTLMPKVRYNDLNGNDEDQSTGAGMDFYFSADSDLGIFGTLEYEFNAYYIYSDNSNFDEDKIGGGTHYWGGVDNKFESGDYTSNGHNLDIEAYLYHTLPLWASESGDYKVQFFHEGGLDPIYFGTGEGTDNTQTLYYEPRLQLIQKINASTEFTYSAGAYYVNDVTKSETHQSDYQWEPRVGLMIRSTF